MSVLGDTRPRVRACPDPGAPEVSAGLVAALDMLRDAHRIVLVGAGERADIVHTVGELDPAFAQATRRVHTLDRIPLRDGRIAPAPSWVRRLRHVSRAATAWLTHGQTAGRLLVEAGLVPGERVHCLPLLTPLDATRTEGSGTARALLRDLLGVAPGVRLVVGVAAHPLPPGEPWARDLLASARRDVAVALLQPVGAPTDERYLVRPATGSSPAHPVRLRDVLAAADIFVAAGKDLEACPPAAAALARGVPVIAVTTDSVAELVRATGPGFVVTPGHDRVMRAVLAQIDSGLPERRPAGPQPDTQHRTVELARALLAVYRHVLRVPAVGGAA